MAIVSQNLTRTTSLLRTVGAFIVAFSVVMSMLVLWVIPSACTFVGSIQLLIFSFLFVIGGIAFLVGTAFSRKRRKLYK